MITKTKEEIVEIISERAGIDKDLIIDDKELVSDLGMDSLDLVELILSIESECGFTTMISDEDAEKWVTVGDVMKYLTEKEVIK